MSDTSPGVTGRLAGGKSPSYGRAVNVPESRASQYTARAMVAGDIAYVLSAAELGCTPAVHARNLLKALLDLLGELPGMDTTKPPADIAQRVKTTVDELAAFETEHLAASNTGVRRPPYQQQCQHRILNARPERGGDGHRQDQRREREDHVHQAHSDVVDRAGAR